MSTIDKSYRKIKLYVEDVKMLENLTYFETVPDEFRARINSILDCVTGGCHRGQEVSDE
jgi:hypothetical protein